MSSLAAVQADGYYSPPDWTPDGGSKSLRATVGTKGAKAAVGKKNAKLKPPQKTIRFEMPFDVGCVNCDTTIGKGVRFNATKQSVGKYHSTTVWAFGMKTTCCGTVVEIRTNPQKSDFDLVKGVKKRLGAGACISYGDEPGTLNNSGQIEVQLHTAEKRQALMADGMARLERTAAAGAERRADHHAAEFFEKNEADGFDVFSDKVPAGKQSSRAPHDDAIDNSYLLRKQSDLLFKNDYDANRQLRRANRSERKNKLANEKERDALGLPSSVELLPVTDGDREAARQAFSGVTGVTSALASGASKNLDSVKRKARDGFDRDRQQNKRAAIRESSIFSGPGVLRGSGYAGTGKTVASSSVSLSQRTRAQKSDSVSYGVPGMSPVVTRPKSNLFGKTSGEPFCVYSSPRSAAKGRGYVPTKFAAARAGGLRGVEVRLAVVAASKEQRGGVSKKSNASRAVVLVKRSSAKIGLARYPSVEYG